MFARRGLCLRLPGEDLVLSWPIAKSGVEGEVVEDLENAPEEERDPEGGDLDRKAGKGWTEGLGNAAKGAGGGHGARPLGCRHDRDDVGLAGGNVHLGDSEACEQKGDRYSEPRAQRDQY